MKRLSEHNVDIDAQNLAGVLCDTCGEELYYVDKEIISSTFPKVRRVKCRCGQLGMKKIAE